MSGNNFFDDFLANAGDILNKKPIIPTKDMTTEQLIKCMKHNINLAKERNAEPRK
jgi:hypothetical protein